MGCTKALVTMLGRSPAVWPGTRSLLRLPIPKVPRIGVIPLDFFGKGCRMWDLCPCSSVTPCSSDTIWVTFLPLLHHEVSDNQRGWSVTACPVCSGVGCLNETVTCLLPTVPHMMAFTRIPTGARRHTEVASHWSFALFSLFLQPLALCTNCCKL